MLVLIGATPEGKKELIGFQTGMRESAQSWKELLVDLKAGGLSIAPEVAVGDGALGFWKALDEMFPATRHQRCWLHKTLNVLDKFPKSVQPNAHKDLREIWLASDQATAETAIAAFAEKYAPKYDKAVECLIKDRETLLTFFDFPADHWDHLRTTNPVESVFATVRHRTVRMKGALSQDTARLMVFKLVMAASKTWRRLQGQNQLPKVIQAPIAAEAVRRIDELFEIERMINGKTPAERAAVRRGQSKQLVEALDRWLREQRALLSAKSDLVKAINYGLSRWVAFTRFLDNGRVCLSNNAAERAVRGIAVGRKNWTFARSDEGGCRAAAVYTLIETCKVKRSVGNFV